MIIAHTLTIEEPDLGVGVVKVQVSHNDTPGSRHEAEEVWKAILATFTTSDITIKRHRA